MSKVEKTLFAVILIFALICLIGVYAKYQDCEGERGVLVRGVFGYECINGK